MTINDYPNSNEPKIRLASVSMRYPQPRKYIDYLLHPFAAPPLKKALEKVNLEIYPGDKVAIMGANGAGKTTFLKLIGGLLYPTEGKITICGNDTRKRSHYSRKSVGFVLNEERSFYWRLTGKENLKFFAALDNMYGARLTTRIDELLDLLEMTSAGDVRVANYSSGMKQRLALARGLLADPEILILDEPTRTLDPIGQKKIKNLVLEKVLSDNQKILLVATHRIEEATEWCNRTAIFDQGKLVVCEQNADILRRYPDLGSFYVKTVSKNNHD